jgi:hypothetical protein
MQLDFSWHTFKIKYSHNCLGILVNFVKRDFYQLIRMSSITALLLNCGSSKFGPYLMANTEPETDYGVSLKQGSQSQPRPHFPIELGPSIPTSWKT